MKKTIAIVGHGLMPSQLAEKAFEESAFVLTGRGKVYKYEANPLINYDYGLTKKQINQKIVPVRTEPKYQNNDLCHCLSGKKFKKCCKK